MTTRFRATARLISSLLLASGLLIPLQARCEESGWGMGLYSGVYYDTEPASVFSPHTRYFRQYLLALHASKSLWRADALPLSVELEGVAGQHFGIASLSEVALAPAVRWEGFPWQESLPTYLRLAPLGVSYTSSISPLERGPTGQGSRTLNFLFIEIGTSFRSEAWHDVFLRLHHRCTIYDLLNDYGANGTDFLTLGFRTRF